MGENKNSNSSTGGGFQVTHQEREGLGRAMIQVLIGTILFAAATAFYVYQARITHKVEQAVIDATDALKGASYAELQSVNTAMDEALSLRKRNRGALLYRAIATTLNWAIHGEDVKAQATEAVKAAKARDIVHADLAACEILLAIDSGNFGNAEVIAKDFATMKRTSPTLFWSRGLMKVAQGDIQGALDEFDAASRTGSAYPYIGITHADLLYASGKKLEAYSYWDLAKRTNANYLQASARNVLTLIERGEPYNSVNKAVTDIDRLMASADKDAFSKADRDTVRLAKGQLALHSGDESRLISALENLPNTSNNLVERLIPFQKAFEAKAYSANAKPSLATEAWNSALKTIAPLAWAEASLKHMMQTAKSEALPKDAEAFFASEPFQKAGHSEDATAWLRGQIELAAGDFKAAQKTFSALTKKDGYKSKGYFGLAKLAVAQNEFETAISTHFKEAVTIRADFPELHYLAATAALAMRDYRDADFEFTVADQQWTGHGADGFMLKAFYQDVIADLGSARYDIKPWQERLERLKESRSEGQATAQAAP